MGLGQSASGQEEVRQGGEDCWWLAVREGGVQALVGVVHASGKDSRGIGDGSFDVAC